MDGQTPTPVGALGGTLAARGHTLLELTVALTLLGVVLSVAVPPARHLADTLAVRGAREAVAAAAVRSRDEAIRRGGARLHLDAAGDVVRVVVGDVEVERVALAPWRADLTIGGGRQTAELYFDALGLGRIASLTVDVRRGGRTAGLVFSAYGRVRRR